MGSRPVSRASVRAGQEGGRKVQPPRRNGKGLKPGDTGRLMNGGPTSKENTGGLHGVGRLLKGQKGNPRNVVKQQSEGKGRKVKQVQSYCRDQGDAEAGSPWQDVRLRHEYCTTGQAWPGAEAGPDEVGLSLRRLS